MLNAGLKGIEDSYPLSEPVECDVYHLSLEEQAELGIECLPGSLIEAIKVVETSEFLEETLGDHIFHNLIMAKKLNGMNEYRKQVHEYEIKTYLPIL